MAEAIDFADGSSVLESLAYLIMRQYGYVISVGSSVLKSLVYLIKRQYGYVISSESYAEDLQEEVGKLAYQADWVDLAVEEARKNFRNVKDHVTKWQEEAKEAMKEARDLLGGFAQASKTCCYGTLPDPSCRYRHQFSRMAMDKIEKIQGLTEDGDGFKELDDISISPSPENVNLTSNELSDDGVFESRALMIRNIMDALADNSNSVVGIYGMGGVGKSTLLVDVERRIRGEGSFDLVAMADVSRNPDIKKIQGEIAHCLGLRIKNKENVSRRADRLGERLGNEKSKVLIMLDNLWKPLNLNSVGIPCGPDNKVIGCKLLLTSRFRDVLRREMGCDRDFRLDALKEEEAKRLFERTVGDKVHDDPFKSLVDEALHDCAGLPLLIVAMAKRFKYADLSEWKDTLRRIRMSKHEGFSEVIHNALQLSYDHLDEEAKSFLQLCVHYGGSEPSLENLVKYGVDVGLFRECSSMEEAIYRLRSGIRTLKASSLLLEDGDADGFKVHDLVREFVISIAPRDQRLLVLNDKDKEVTEHLRA